MARRIAPAIDGAIVMNEVLDAIPPHLIVRRNGQWLERGVTAAFALEWRTGRSSTNRCARSRRSGSRRPATMSAKSNPAAEALSRMSAGA